MDPPEDGKAWRAASDPTSLGPSASYSLSAQVKAIDPGNPAREPASIKPEPFLERTTWERATTARETQQQRQSGWMPGRAAAARSQAVDEAAASLTLLPAPGSRVGARYPAGGPADVARGPQQRPPSFGGGLSQPQPQPYGFPAFGVDRHAAALQYPLQQRQQQQQQHAGGGMFWPTMQHPSSLAPPLGASGTQGERLALGWDRGFGGPPLPPPSHMSPWGAPGSGFAAGVSAALQVRPATDPSTKPGADDGGGAGGAALDPLRPTVLIGGLGGGADGDSPRGGSPPPEVMMQHAAALLSLAEFLPDGDDAQAPVPCPPT